MNDKSKLKQEKEIERNRRKEEKERKLADKFVFMTEYERKLWSGGIDFVAGVDEVGRGPLAGPVVAACVALPKDFNVLGIDDSKKLSEKKRLELDKLIRENAIAIGIGEIDNKRIDKVNILNATKEAMLIAIHNANEIIFNSIQDQEGIQNEDDGRKKIEHLLIDALPLPESGIRGTAIIKGDTKSISIAAASIIAKVYRDNLMKEYAIKYPYYSFESNKGYGTKVHYQGLSDYGITPIHRRSFLKGMLLES